MEVINARITGTFLGIQHNDIFTFWVYLDFYNGGGQAFGGFAMDNPVNIHTENFHREGTSFGMECVMQILKVVGVESWEELKGKPCRVARDNKGWLTKIGPPCGDAGSEWFCPDELANKYRAGLNVSSPSEKADI
jgi:hypothetical protein